MIMHDLSGLGPNLVDRNPIHSEEDIIEITDIDEASRTVRFGNSKPQVVVHSYA